MKTPSQELAELTRLSNQYRREAQKIGIASPFRQGIFIKHRLAGKSMLEAKELTRTNGMKDGKAL